MWLHSPTSLPLTSSLYMYVCMCVIIAAVLWQYLHDMLDSVIKTLLDPNIDCEVDPMKIQCQDNLAANQASLLNFVQMVWYRIVSTEQQFPRYDALACFLLLSLCCKF